MSHESRDIGTVNKRHKMMHCIVSDGLGSGPFFNLKGISNVQYMLKNSTQQFMLPKKIRVRSGYGYREVMPIPEPYPYLYLFSVYFLIPFF